MYNEKIEQLIKAALADGVLTEKEKQVLFKRAQEEGIDLDEFEMVLDARLFEAENAAREKREKAAPKSDKYADVKKCPACGSIIPPNTKVCPGCGMVFSNNQEDIKDIAKLQDNYIRFCEIKPKFPTAPLLLSVVTLIVFVNVLAIGMTVVDDLLWLLLSIPLAIGSFYALFFLFILIAESAVYMVFNKEYSKIIAEHEKMVSTAQTFYSQSKETLQRIEDIKNRFAAVVAKNKKFELFYLIISYGVLLASIITSIILCCLWIN